MLLSCDDGGAYAAYWGPVAFAWRHLVGIEPVLFVVGEEEARLAVTTGGFVRRVRRVDGVPVPLQAQLARLWGLQEFADDVCLTSDLDMLPLSRDYFTTAADSCRDDTVVILSSDAYAPVERRYPICYVEGTGAVLAEALALDRDFAGFCRRLDALGWGWHTDELYLGRCIEKWGGPVGLLRRGWLDGWRATGRVDRLQWEYDPEAAAGGHYIDAHLPRPYASHAAEIDALLGAAMGRGAPP